MNVLARHAQNAAEIVPMTFEALGRSDDQGCFDNDLNKYELINGIFVVIPPPGSNHHLDECRLVMATMKAVIEADLNHRLAVPTRVHFE